MPRLGVVPYLNAVPLLDGLEPRALVSATPSRLAGMLARGEVDAALLPVAEAIRGVGSGFLGRHGIASDGAVGSVLLFLRRPLAAVRTLVLDPASRTSAVLALHLTRLEAGEGVHVEEATRPGPDPQGVEADAVLVIGDAALAAFPTWKGRTLDLGEAWKRRTGLPFVYARWTARAGLAPGERAALAAALDQAATGGLARRGALARAWARARGLDEEAAARYVETRVRYEIGPREEEGLACFAAIVRAVEATAPGTLHA